MHRVILLVDEQLDCWEMAVTALERAGYYVLQAGSSYEANNILGQRSIDLLLISGALEGEAHGAEDFISSLPEDLTYARVTNCPRVIKSEQRGAFIWYKADIPDLLDLVAKVFCNCCYCCK